MNIEEALKKIDELNETVEELKQEVEEKTEEVTDTFENITEHYSDSLDIEGQEKQAEQSFYAGYKAGANSEFVLQAWLNHKIEARL